MTRTVLVPHRCRTAAGTETCPLRLTFTRVAVTDSLYMVVASLYGQDEAARGNASTGGGQDRAGAGALVDRGAADLADRLGDAVHAVNVGLAELAAVRVERQATAHFDGAVGDEVPGLPGAAEAELLEAHEHRRGEGG